MKSDIVIERWVVGAACGVCMLLMNGVSAVPVVGGSVGLLTPDTLIDFGTTPPSPTSPITTQFAPLTFSSSFLLGWSTSGSTTLDNVTGGLLAQFGFSSFPPAFTMDFGQAVVDALFNFRAANGSRWLMESLSGASVIESMTFAGFNTDGPVSSNFYGFIGSSFNAVRLTLQSGNQGLNLDNVQFNIPEPTTVLLLGFGLAALGFATRSRR